MQSQVDVRHGRARLTILTSGDPLAENELSRTLDRYEANDASPEEVAWAYVRTRTIDHSPSFKWEESRLGPLIELVTGVSESPKVEATTPAGLAAFLSDERKQAKARQAPTPAAAPATAPVAAAAPAPVPAAPPKRAAAAPAAATVPAQKKRPLPLRVLGAIIPSRTLWRVLLAVGLIFIVAAYFGVRYYLDEVPGQLADDYREKAQPATERITDAMDRTFAAYDRYLDNSTLPRSQIQNADNFEEIKRRFLPLYDDTERALDSADRSIKSARKAIAKEREDLTGVETKPFVGDSDEVTEAEDAADSTDEYLTRASQFLRNFQRFVDFDQKALEFRRAQLAQTASEDITGDSSLEEVKAAAAKDLQAVKESREDLLKLKPHPDQEKLYDVAVEEDNVTIDYFENLIQAYNDLSLPELKAADSDFADEYKPLRDQTSYLLGVFASKSSLQLQSRKVEDLGDDLELRIADLGSGDGHLVRPDLTRPPVPPLPRKPSDGSGESGGSSDKSVS